MLGSGLATILRLKKLRREEVPASTPKRKLYRQPDGLAVRIGSGNAHGGYDRNRNEPKAMPAEIAHIHANPDRALGEKAEDWRWSGAAWYAGSGDVPLVESCSIARPVSSP
jgi:hypothetical protein